MLVHTVFFYLKSDISAADRAMFATELAKLGTIDNIGGFYMGSPAEVPPRPVIDTTFDFSITVVVDDVEAHNAYQIDPIHLAFIASCKHLWDRVQVYDVD
ncbi:Dabb family protein [Synoicihabitans lomoniglobus]|uniref:Dabb family protein n=1 Tax=Synoicihabitans lomoniglobus TaxID=2909285 RepID=A0AAF0CS49_9BACT|nr:Dabb family protein [Opitutaceae bacterium LMO-M01]WED67089.1 Dabb family protein [Opitutaceae bacterium LMO-M01]